MRVSCRRCQRLDGPEVDSEDGRSGSMPVVPDVAGSDGWIPNPGPPDEGLMPLDPLDPDDWLPAPDGPGFICPDCSTTHEKLAFMECCEEIEEMLLGSLYPNAS